MDFIRANFLDISQTESFMEMPMIPLLDLLCDNGLRVSNVSSSFVEVFSLEQFSLFLLAVLPETEDGNCLYSTFALPS